MNRQSTVSLLSLGKDTCKIIFELRNFQKTLSYEKASHSAKKVGNTEAFVMVFPFFPMGDFSLGFQDRNVIDVAREKTEERKSA